MLCALIIVHPEGHLNADIHVHVLATAKVKELMKNFCLLHHR